MEIKNKRARNSRLRVQVKFQSICESSPRNSKVDILDIRLERIIEKKFERLFYSDSWILNTVNRMLGED